MRPALAAVALAAAVLAIGAPARAACMGAAASFETVSRDAQTIVIGTVFDAQPVEPGSAWASAFSLRLDHVVRGHAVSPMAFRDLSMNRVCGVVVLVREGDRIALALGGHDFEPPAEVNALAHLTGQPFHVDVPTVTVAEVYAMAGAQLPDSAVDPPSSFPLVVPSVAAIAVAAIWLRATSRGPRHSRR